MGVDDQAINEVRRENRAVKDEAWIKSFLNRAPFGVLGTEWQGQPFLKPTTFVYHEADRALYFHGALQGRTRLNLEANPRASFCVSEMGRLLPAKTARGFGVEYSSVVVFGKVKILEERLAARALQFLMDKYFPAYQPLRDYPPLVPEDTSDTTVYCFEIESCSGKRAQAAADYPGAFFYPEGRETGAGS